MGRTTIVCVLFAFGANRSIWNFIRLKPSVKKYVIIKEIWEEITRKLGKPPAISNSSLGNPKIKFQVTKQKRLMKLWLFQTLHTCIIQSHIDGSCLADIVQIVFHYCVHSLDEIFILNLDNKKKLATVVVSLTVYKNNIFQPVLTLKLWPFLQHPQVEKHLHLRQRKLPLPRWPTLRRKTSKSFYSNWGNACSKTSKKTQ